MNPNRPKCTNPSCSARPRKLHPSGMCEKCRRLTLSAPEEAARCAICDILIFENEAAAHAVNVPYHDGQNKAHDGLCTGCHHGDSVMVRREYSAGSTFDATISLRGLR